MASSLRLCLQHVINDLALCWELHHWEIFCPCANVTKYICTSPDSTAWGVWRSLPLLGNKLQNTVHQTLSTNATLCWVPYPNSKHSRQRTLKKKQNKKVACRVKHWLSKGKDLSSDHPHESMAACSCHPALGERRNGSGACWSSCQDHLPFSVWCISLKIYSSIYFHANVTNSGFVYSVYNVAE